MEYLCCSLVGYLMGCVNPSYFIAKSKGVDIKKKGSGNAGASNVVLLFGKVRGIICALYDIFKAYFAIMITEKLMFPAFEYAFAITGTACILGHIFPFYMKFSGGKGLASLGGMILAFDWRVFLIMLACEIIVVLITDYICFVPITAVLTFPVVYGLITQNLIAALIMLPVSLVIIYKHIENIRRILKGQEVRFSFLWNSKAEEERVKKNLGK